MPRSPSSCGSVFTNWVLAPGCNELRIPVSIARHAGLMTASPLLPEGRRQTFVGMTPVSAPRSSPVSKVKT